MRLLLLTALVLASAPAAFAQQAAAPQPTIAFSRPVEAEEAVPASRAAAVRLEGRAEQLRLNALAYLGLGNAEAAARAVAKLVALGYTPQPNDPASFTTLVASAVEHNAPATDAAPREQIARGH